LTFKGPLTGVTALRLELLTDPSLPAMGPGRAENGNLVLHEFTASVGPEGKPNEAKPLAFGKALADFSQEGFAVAGAIDGKLETGWAISPQFGKPHTAVFELKEPLTLIEGQVLTILMDQRYTDNKHNIGKFRLSTTTSKPPLALEGPPEAIAKLLDVEPDKRTDQQKAELTRYFRAMDQEYGRLQAELNAQGKPGDPRLIGAQNLVWAMINNKAFWFNY
jgi:hypothetical protein